MGANDWLTPQVIWFAIGFVLMVIEFTTPGIVILFFGMGAWLVALLCLFIDLSINAQLLIFIASSILFLVFLRKWVKKLFQMRIGSDRAQEELAEFVGGKAMVTKQITPKIKGKVEFHGSYWDAEATETISEGQPVEIIDKKNITLIVKPI